MITLSCLSDKMRGINFTNLYFSDFTTRKAKQSQTATAVIHPRCYKGMD